MVRYIRKLAKNHMSYGSAAIKNYASVLGTVVIVW
jgi:hypothetical protein